MFKFWFKDKSSSVKIKHNGKYVTYRLKAGETLVFDGLDTCNMDYSNSYGASKDKHHSGCVCLKCAEKVGLAPWQWLPKYKDAIRHTREKAERALEQEQQRKGDDMEYETMDRGQLIKELEKVQLQLLAEKDHGILLERGKSELQHLNNVAYDKIKVQKEDCARFLNNIDNLNYESSRLKDRITELERTKDFEFDSAGNPVFKAGCNNRCGNSNKEIAELKIGNNFLVSEVKRLELVEGDNTKLRATIARMNAGGVTIEITPPDIFHTHRANEMWQALESFSTSAMELCLEADNWELENRDKVPKIVGRPINNKTARKGVTEGE